MLGQILSTWILLRISLAVCWLIGNLKCSLICSVVQQNWWSSLGASFYLRSRANMQPAKIEHSSVGIWNFNTVSERKVKQKWNVKQRLHLSLMRMQMMNLNVTKNWKHRIRIEVLPFVRMWSTTTTTKWIPSWAIGANANGLSDRKSLHMHGCLRVAHASHRGKTILVP